MCVGYTDLNNACPKNNYPLSHIDRLVDATLGYELLTFIDAFSRYDLMTLEDQEQTSFIITDARIIIESYHLG